MDNVLAWFDGYFSNFHDTAWVIEVFMAVFVTAILAFSESFIFKKIYPKLQNSRTAWDDSVVQALHLPLHFLIWLLGLSLAANIVAHSGKNVAIFAIIEPVVSFGIIILLTWFLLRLVGEVESNYANGRTKKKSVDKTTVYALGKIFRVAVIITAVLVALQTYGIPITGVLAFGGIGTAAIAFSAKDLLANYFGGLIVYLDRPFAVGDWIRSPDRNIEGVVEHIGWRLCRIRTFDKRPLYVPNTIFTQISIENPSRMTNRRIYTQIGLRYDDANKVGDILKAIEIMLKDHPEIDTNQTLMVNLVEFAASSLSFMVYTFTKTTNWQKFQAIQQDVFLKIIDIVLDYGAEFAFPTTTMHIPDGIQVKKDVGPGTLQQRMKHEYS